MTDTIGNGQVTYLPTTHSSPELITTSLYNDANLVAYYRLSDTSDSKGSYTLTNNNSVAFNQGKFGNGADFGSSNTTKWLGNSSFTRPSLMTVSAWVKPTATSGLAMYAVGGDDAAIGKNERSFQLVILDSTNQARFLVFTNNSTFAYVVSTSSVIDGNWHHIAGTYDGSNVKLYIDGVYQGASALSGTVNAGTNIGIGRASDIGDNTPNYSGMIDDVAIFSRALSASEVASLYAEGSCKAYYPLNGDALDFSGNGYNLTNNNSVTLGTTNGRFGGGADFGSSNTNKSLTGADIDTDYITISCWFNCTKTNTGDWFGIIASKDAFVSQLGTGDRGIILGVDWTSSVFSVNATVFNASSNTGISAVSSINTWHHTALTYNGASAILYIDGVKVAEGALSGILRQNNQVYTFGRRNVTDSNSGPYCGFLDEVIISSYAWSAKEVRDFYSSSVGRYQLN